MAFKTSEDGKGNNRMNSKRAYHNFLFNHSLLMNEQVYRNVLRGCHAISGLIR